MAESELSYEEMRKRRLEENKKRMEELNLKSLSQALKSKSVKSSPVSMLYFMHTYYFYYLSITFLNLQNLKSRRQSPEHLGNRWSRRQ